MDNKPVYYSDERSNVCILCSWGSDAGPVVTIPSFVGGIYKTCFYQCKNLTHIKVDSANSYLVDIDGILYTKNMQFLVSVPPARESVEISEDIERMFEFAFRNCRNLTSIKIPNKVKCIEDAFGGCTSLRNVVFPDNLKSFAENAFSENEILKNITFSVSPNNTNITIVDNVVFAKGGKQLLRMLGTQTHYTIPDGVEEIADFAFAYRDIRSVDIPNTVKSIGEGAFRFCKSLETVTMHDNTKAIIKRVAFGHCESLKSIDIAYGVTSIDYDAFEECSSLTHVGIPKTVKGIGGSFFVRAFYNTCNLKEIVVDPENAHYVVKDGVLFTKDLKTLIYCPAQKTGKYTIPSETTVINYCAFSNSNLDVLVISENIEKFALTPFTGNRIKEVHWMKNPERIECNTNAGNPFDELKNSKQVHLWHNLPKRKETYSSCLSFDEDDDKCVSNCNKKA